MTSDYKINMQAYLYQCNTGSDIINYNKNTYMHIYYTLPHLKGKYKHKKKFWKREHPEKKKIINCT